MRRIGRAGWLLVAALVASGPTSIRSDDAPKADPKAAAEAVDRVLGEWHRRASKVTSLDVKFRQTDISKRFGDSKAEGRAVLAAPNLALLETVPLDDDGKPAGGKTRLVWTGRHQLVFDPDSRAVFRHPIPAPGDIHPDLCLPFLFGMSVERAKADHDWEVVREDKGRITLKVTRKDKSKRLFDTHQKVFLVELDEQTYQPKKVFHHDGDAALTTIYEVLELKLNSVTDVFEMKDPCLDAWKLIDIPSTFPKN